MTSVLITGGAGFVGSSLALGLRAHSADVTVIAADNLRRRGSEFNLGRLRAAGVRFVHADIRNASDVALLPKADLLLECSAEPSAMAGYVESPVYAVDTNLIGTYHCLEWARTFGAAVIFLSSSRVYPIPALSLLSVTEEETRFGLSASQPMQGASARGIAEDFPLDGHRSLYGATKLCSELLLTEYTAMYGMRSIVNRCGLVAGPWQMGKIDQGVVVYWVARHHYNLPLRYIGYGGKGKQVRDVLHIEDLVELTLRQIERLDELSGQTFNVGGGLEQSASLLELTAHCRAATGRSMEIGCETETRPGDIPLYVSDNRKVSEATGWSPRRGVGETCEDIARWIGENDVMLAPVLAGEG